MSLYDDVKGLDIYSVIQGGPFALIESSSLDTGGLDVYSTIEGGPFVATAGAAAPPAEAGVLSRVYPGMVRVYPGLGRLYPI